MIDNKTKEIINKILGILKQKYPDFRGIYLFGSRARGNFHSDSDYDLAIIFNRKVESEIKREISGIIAIIMMEYEVIIDNPVLNYQDILNPITPLRENIKNEGIFYEAA